MFDIGFAELVIIAVISLLVIGPERLPDAIRTASAWLNRIRRGFNDIKQEVQQELHNDAVMKELQELRDTGESLRQDTQAMGRSIGESMSPAEKSASASSDESEAVHASTMSEHSEDAERAESSRD